MSDLIRREDVLKAIWDWCCNREYTYTNATYWLQKRIESIPSAERKGEWIPCSERMPSEQGEYLVTFPLCNGDPCAHVLSFCKGKFYETDDEWGDIEYDDVTAWMPLPKPYGEREGE